MARKVPFLFPTQWRLAGPTELHGDWLKAIIDHLAGPRWPTPARIGAVYVCSAPFFQRQIVFVRVDVMVEDDYFGALDLAFFERSAVLIDGSRDAFKAICAASPSALHSPAQVQGWLHFLFNSQRVDGDSGPWIIESWDDLPLQNRHDIAHWEKTSEELLAMPVMKVTPLLGAKLEFWRADLAAVWDGIVVRCRFGVKRDGLLSAGVNKSVAKNMPSIWFDGVIRRFRE